MVLIKFIKIMRKYIIRFCVLIGVSILFSNCSEQKKESHPLLVHNYDNLILLMTLFIVAGGFLIKERGWGLLYHKRNDGLMAFAVPSIWKHADGFLNHW